MQNISIYIVKTKDEAVGQLWTLKT